MTQLHRYEVKGNIVVLFDETSEIVEAKNHDEAIERALVIHRSRYPKADCVDWNDEDWGTPEAVDLGPVPEDQIMLRFPAEIAPQLPGFERPRGAA